MYEFYYYGTTVADNTEIIDHVLRNTDLYLIPHMNYKSQNDLLFARNISDNVIEILANKTGQFHFWKNSFYPIFPLSFYTYKNEQCKGMLALHASPSLTLDTSNFVINNEGNCLRLAAGCMYYTRELYDEDNHAVIPIPQAVKDEHKKVVKLMKEKLKKLKKKNIWLGKEAFFLFEKNELEIYDGMRWLKKEYL